MTTSGQALANVRDAALAYLSVDLSVVPIQPDGSKRPRGIWKPLQERAMEPAEIDRRFRDGDGVGIIGGAVSGNLEILDFDQPGLFEEWIETLEVTAPDLAQRLQNGDIPIVATPSGGAHVYYRWPVVEGNQKIAEEDRLDPETGELKRKTLIETRGRGGYAVAPPSPPGCHPSGKPYVLLQGDLLKIPTLFAKERQALLDAARTYNRIPKRDVQPTYRVPRGEEDGRPGDAFNRAAEWRPLLEPAGWEHVRDRSDGASEWRRPGKHTPGISATLGYCTKDDGTPLLHVFSTNASPFEPDCAYSPFTAYTFLKHGGDYSAAARDLRNRGYGQDGAPEVMGDHRDEAKRKPSREQLEAGRLPESLTDLGNALRFVRLRRADVRFVGKWKKWLLWDGRRWEADPGVKILAEFDAVLRELIQIEARLRKKAAKLKLEAKTMEEG